MPKPEGCEINEINEIRAVGDAATFIAPAFLVAYLAVGCLLLWGRVG